MCKFLCGILLFVVVSCSGKEEVLDFEDISKSSDKYKEESAGRKDTLTGKILPYDQLTVFAQNWVDSLFYLREGINLLDTNLFSDRFGAEKSEKWYYKSEQDSLVWMHWEFKDSIRAQNTFYNWLDCFGNSCKSVMVGQEAYFTKRGLILLLQDKHLFSIESNRKQDFERYLSFFDSQKWESKWKYIMVQAPRKKGKWFSRDSEGTLIPIAWNQ